MRHYPRVCALQCLLVQWCSGGGVFVSPAPAYADGYVDGTGNNIYYGFKTDASYSEARFHIEVDYYDTLAHAKAGEEKGKDPLGKFVRVHYLSNCNKDGGTADDWRFRPMWWFGVPKGLQNVQDITYTRVEKLTQNGKKQPFTPAGSSQFKFTNAQGYGQVSQKKYNKPEEWNNISNFYFKDSKVLASKGWKQLLGIDDKESNGYDNTGNTKTNWQDYQNETAGLQGIFVDWESAGQRFYDMTYVGEMTDDAWKKRDENPLRFAAGVYRFAGNWHYAVGQKHNTPKIADHMKVQYPTQTPVKNKTKLEPDEKTKVQNAIYDANKDATPHFKDLLDGAANITVGEDGTATLKFKDNTTLTMPGNLLVVEKKKDNVKFPPVYPAPIGVVNPQNLSDADQQAIIQGFKTANKDKDFLTKVSDKDSDVYKFDNTKHELTITYKDGSSLTIPYDQLVYQGATIADWAPYVVPGYTEVVNPSSLTQKEITELIAKFDKANEKLGIYNAAKQNGKSPVTIATNGTATITWKDGSQTIVPGFLYLKKKAPEAPKPNPTGDEKKYFTVAVPTDISSVNFDPFNMKATDLTDQVNSAQLESIKDTLKALTATDTKDSNTHPQIIDVTFAVDKNGVGTVTFTADKYESATYPMGMFMKQNPNKQTPKETEHSPKGKTQYKYKVKPIQYDGNAPTPPQQIQALKDFVQFNYGTDISSDAGASGGIYVLKKTDIPVQGTSGLQFYDKDSSDGAGVATIDCTTSTDGSLTIQGYEKGDKNIKTLFTVPASELYVKRSASTDHTLSDLKQQAKALLKKRKDDGLKDSDFAKAGIADPTNLNDNTINGMNEQQLRDLIRKLTDAKKAERKYNEPGVVEFDKGATNDAKFKEAVKAFLKANYTNPEVVTDTSITSPLTLPSTLTAKADTVYMGIDADGIKSLSKDASNNIVITASDNSTFTVNVKYKEKDATPSPTPGDDKQLQEMKKQAEELIDRNPKLTDEQKKQFKSQIDQADTKEKIQDILKKANEQAGKNTVKPEDIKEKEKKEKEKREKEQKEKDKKEREEKQKQQLEDDKKKAKETLDTLSNLTTDGDSGDKKKLSDEIDNAKASEDVKKILEKANAINDARGALKEGALPFLSHGKSDSNDDKALKELIGADPSKKDQTLTDLETALTAKDATADSVNKALDAAKRQNGINEQNAKNAGIAKLDALLQEITSAESSLTDAQKTEEVKTKISAAKDAITKAKNTVNAATKPSQIKDALNIDATIKAAKDAINTQVTNAQKTSASDPSQTQNGKLGEEKKKAEEEIDNIPGLSQEEKDKYKELINQSTHSGDPEAIVNQAKKHKKIEDALKKLDEFRHLNDAQKQAFKDIINDTDAHNHTDENGKDLGIDDIDVALANAANTDNAMARLEELKKTADDFSNGNTYKNFADKTKKDAFDAAYKAAKDVLDKADGDAKNADQVNELYKDLLKAMRAIDPDAKSAGLKTAALAAEIDSDKKLQPSETDPKTPGNPVYNTSSKAKKDDFDKALNEAQTVLDGAKAADISTADKEADEQKEIDAALDKLIKARLALDGVDTTDLQKEIGNAPTVEESDAYKLATNKSDYDTALKNAKELIDKLTGKTPATAGEKPKTQAEKQNLVDDALAKLKAAEEALDGHAPTPTPTPSVDKSHLQQGINGSGDVKKSDDYNNAPSDKKQAYDHALDHANEVNNNPNATQDQVNQAAEDLKKAEHDLKPAPTPSVDKSHLQQGINGSDDVHNSDDYTNAPSDKKQAYDHALDHANEVNKDPNATQDQVNQAAEDLKNAQKDLHDSATVDKSHLQSEVSDDVAFRDRGSYLVADAPHKDAYNAALSEARRVLADPNATQAQVNAALSKLREAKRNILQANGLSGDEYAGDGNTGTGNTGAGNTGTVPGSSVVPGTVPGTVPGSGDSGFGSTGTSNAGTSNTGTTNSGVAGSGHEGDSSLGFGVNDNAPTTVDKGELNLQIQGAESDSQSANAGNAGVNSGNAGANNAGANNAGANAGNDAGANNAANAGNAGANAGNAGANAAANNNAAVTAAVENNPAVKQADVQVAAAQAALDSALAEAKKVAADHNATQAQVDAAKRKLADARKNLADAQAHAAQVRASVRAQVLKSGKVAQLSNTGSAVSALSTFAATIAAAGAALFVSKRRGTSRHCSK